MRLYRLLHAFLEIIVSIIFIDLVSLICGDQSSPCRRHEIYTGENCRDALLYKCKNISIKMLKDVGMTSGVARGGSKVLEHPLCASCNY